MCPTDSNHPEGNFGISLVGLESLCWMRFHFWRLVYLEHLEKAEYVKSYKQAAEDKDTLTLAEEGMEDYYGCMTVLHASIQGRAT